MTKPLMMHKDHIYKKVIIHMGQIKVKIKFIGNYDLLFIYF
jgi:hypothetical protein